MIQTFANDAALPSLPVPELAATCEAVLELAEPLVDGTVFSATREAVRELAAEGGTGQRLHELLLDCKTALPGNASWLRPLWDDMYLAWRDPLPINMNYCFRLTADRWGGERALPRLVRALAATACRLRDGELPPEPCRAGALSMDQAASCFYTRIPCAGSDVLLRTDLTAPLTVAAVCKGRWYIVPLTGSGGTLAGESALAGAFAAVRRDAERHMDEARPVGALTAAPRPVAAALRAALLEGMQNRLSLALLEKSLFVVCLDPPHASDDAFMHSLLCGPAGSRWFDKSLQLVSSENGGLGANFEHAGCDAAIWLYLLGLCDKRIAQESLSGPNDDPNDCPDDGRGGSPGGDRDEALAIRPLQWHVPDPLLAGLDGAGRDFATRSAGVDLRCRAFAEYSREGLKKLGTSPDAFLQIGFQAAQHRIFGRLRSSYEAVAVRGFAQGRTECARGCTAEAAGFARMLEGGQTEEALRQYRLAETAHKARLARCQQGLGAERHMTGLAAMHTLHGDRLGLGDLPALFRDPGWLTVKHDALSTSGIGAPFIRFFGFGPVVPDGYGVGYAPGPEATGLVVTSFKNRAEPSDVFVHAFAESAGAAAKVLMRQDTQA